MAKVRVIFRSVSVIFRLVEKTLIKKMAIGNVMKATITWTQR